MQKIYLIGIILFLVYFIFKYFCFSQNEMNPFGNNLMKYISSGEEKYKENLPKNDKLTNGR
jgi:hypothetical protein